MQYISLFSSEVFQMPNEYIKIDLHIACTLWVTFGKLFLPLLPLSETNPVWIATVLELLVIRNSSFKKKKKEKDQCLFCGIYLHGRILGNPPVLSNFDCSVLCATSITSWNQSTWEEDSVLQSPGGWMQRLRFLGTFGLFAKILVEHNR